MKLWGLFTIIFILLITISLYSGNSIYEHDIKNGITRNIYNYTDNEIIWNSSNFKIKLYNASKTQDISHLRINNIINKMLDSIGYSTLETSKYFIEVGYNSHGKYDLKTMINIIKFILWFIIITTLFYPALIIAVSIYEFVKYISKKINNKNKKK